MIGHRVNIHNEPNQPDICDCDVHSKKRVNSTMSCCAMFLNMLDKEVSRVRNASGRVIHRKNSVFPLALSFHTA